MRLWHTFSPPSLFLLSPARTIRPGSQAVDLSTNYWGSFQEKNPGNPESKSFILQFLLVFLLPGTSLAVLFCLGTPAPSSGFSRGEIRSGIVKHEPSIRWRSTRTNSNFRGESLGTSKIFLSFLRFSYVF